MLIKMKKFVALMAVFAVVSCSGSNDDKEDMPTITGKQYVFKNDTLIASVSFDNSNYASLQVFNRRSICFSDWLLINKINFIFLWDFNTFAINWFFSC